MRGNTKKHIRGELINLGIDVDLLEHFAPRCATVQSVLSELWEIIDSRDDTYHVAREKQKIMKVMTRAIAQLSFRGRLSFDHAFKLEKEKAEKKS